MNIKAISNISFGEYDNYEMQRLERKIDDLKFALERSENKNPYYTMPKTPSPYAPPPPPHRPPMYGMYGPMRPGFPPRVGIFGMPMPMFPSPYGPIPTCNHNHQDCFVKNS